MEDVLEVYQRPFDPMHPVVCIDEMNRQLVEQTRIPCKAGQPEKVDSEYVRKGECIYDCRTACRKAGYLSDEEVYSH